MKKTILLNLIFISSVFLFSACSTKEIKPKKLTVQPSIYTIMGVSNPKRAIVHFIVKDEPHRVHTSHYMSKVQIIPKVQASHEIKVSSESQVSQENQLFTEPQISPDIEFISYRQDRISEDLVSNKFTDIDTDKIEKNAKSFLGTPYIWGATGPNAFDCSGFTQWVFRDAGINIPRVSRNQAKVGEYVRYENLQRGDMVFFDTKKHPNGKVTHVGIYLGDGNFIHASSAGKKVVIFNFNKKNFYKKHFLWGRRLLNSNLHYASN